MPIKVQALIQRSLRTLSNSISNRSPEVFQNFRSSSNSLKPVDEEIGDALEEKWYTLEEQAQEQMHCATNAGQESSQPNPFRSLHKKEKEKDFY